ncbi:MAG: hypothetical protein HUU02_03770 [Bacteroidetes bacterium]|nr:hypothetical protein [Bacteroidota bacterium]
MNLATKLMHQWKLALLLAVTLPLSYQCTDIPASPVAPKWTTQLTVQLLKRTFFFEDMIRKDSTKFTTVNGELVYKPASQNNKPEAINLPEMKPVAALFTRALGLIPITSVTVPGVEIGGVFSGLPLAQKIVIDTSIVIGDTTLYEYLVYEDGYMKINLSNTMNFDWIFTTPMEVFNSDINGAELTKLGQFNIGTVAKNVGVKRDSFAITQPQNGYMKMKFRLESEAPIPFPGTIIINNGRLTIGFGISNAAGGNPSLSEAKMKLLQEFYLPVTSIQDSAQKLSDSIFIKSATFKGGAFDIVINNGIPFDVIIGFNLREFVNRQTNGSFRLKDANGIPQDSITIKGRSSYIDPVLMKDYMIAARRVNGGSDTLTKDIHFSLSIKTLVKSPTKVVIKKTDSVLVEIRPKQTAGVNDPYVLDEVQGKIPPNIVSISDTIPAGVGSSNDNFSADSIKFDGAQIMLKIFTKSLFPTDLKFTVKGFADGTPTDSLSTPKGTGKNASPDGVSYRILPGDTAKIIFDKHNADANGKTIDAFLSKFIRNGKFKFPDKFAIGGNAIISPQDQYISTDPASVGVVKDDDSVYTSLDFSFPLKIGIVNGLYAADTASIGDNVDTSLTNSIVEGTIGFNLASTFPVALDIYSNLIKADPADPTKPSRDPLTNSVITFPQDSTKLPLGVPGALDNQVKVEYRSISLSDQDAKKVAQARFNAVQIKMRTAADNGNTPLAFVKDDSIQVITVANIKFRVDQDKLK